MRRRFAKPDTAQTTLHLCCIDALKCMRKKGDFCAINARKYMADLIHVLAGRGQDLGREIADLRTAERAFADIFTAVLNGFKPPVSTAQELRSALCLFGVAPDGNKQALTDALTAAIAKYTPTEAEQPEVEKVAEEPEVEKVAEEPEVEKVEKPAESSGWGGWVQIKESEMENESPERHAASPKLTDSSPATPKSFDEGESEPEKPAEKPAKKRKAEKPADAEAEADEVDEQVGLVPCTRRARRARCECEACAAKPKRKTAPKRVPEARYKPQRAPRMKGFGSNKGGKKKRKEAAARVAIVASRTALEAFDAVTNPAVELYLYAGTFELEAPRAIGTRIQLALAQRVSDPASAEDGSALSGHKDRGLLKLLAGNERLLVVFDMETRGDDGKTYRVRIAVSPDLVWPNKHRKIHPSIHQAIRNPGFFTHKRKDGGMGRIPMKRRADHAFQELGADYDVSDGGTGGESDASYGGDSEIER